MLHVYISLLDLHGVHNPVSIHLDIGLLKGQPFKTKTYSQRKPYPSILHDPFDLTKRKHMMLRLGRKLSDAALGNIIIQLTYRDQAATAALVAPSLEGVFFPGPGVAVVRDELLYSTLRKRGACQQNRPWRGDWRRSSLTRRSNARRLGGGRSGR
jgi:hypothetical protein